MIRIIIRLHEPDLSLNHTASRFKAWLEKDQPILNTLGEVFVYAITFVLVAAIGYFAAAGFFH